MHSPAYQTLLPGEVSSAGKVDADDQSFLQSIEEIPNGSRRRSRKQPFNYRPVFLRPASLVVLFLLTLALIGALEYVAVHFPHRSTIQEVRNDVAKAHQDAVNKRSSRHVPESNVYQINRRAGLMAMECGSNVLRRSAPPVQNAPPPSSPAPSEPSRGAFVKSAHAVSTTEVNPSAFVGSTTVMVTETRGAFVSSKTPSPMRQTNPTGPNGTPKAQGPTSDTSERGRVLNSPSTERPTTINPANLHTTTNTAGRTIVVASSASVRFVLPVKPSDNSTQQVSVVRAGGVFASSYLPTLGAVIYRMLWSVVSSSFNLIEPFRLLARPEGASASVALFASFQSKSTFLWSLWRMEWALAIISAFSSVTDILPALASETMYLSTNWPDCPGRNDTDIHNPCPRRIETEISAVRGMQVVLALACVVLCWLWIFLSSTKTGLTGDPRSMAAVASLMRHNGLLQDFNEITSDDDREDMKQKLSQNQYRLAHFQNEAGINYGIKPIGNSDDLVATTSTQSYGLVEQHELEGDRCEHPISKKPHRSKHWIFDLLLITTVLGTFGVVLAYYLVSGHNGFNDFFDSDSFGPRFILTLAATGIATLWKRAETSTMIMAPYQRLAKRSASAQSTVLFKPSTTPLVSTARCLRHGYFLVAAVTVVVLLGDLGLNTVISSVPYARAQSWRQSMFSTYATLGILALMLLTSFSLMIVRLRESHLPRRPDTLGAVMSYVAAGPLPYDVDDMQDQSTGKNYQLVKIRKMNGSHAWSVTSM